MKRKKVAQSCTLPPVPESEAAKGVIVPTFCFFGSTWKFPGFSLKKLMCYSLIYRANLPSVLAKARYFLSQRRGIAYPATFS